MAIAYQSVTTQTATTGGTSFNVARPGSTASGNLLVAINALDSGDYTDATVSGGATWNFLGFVDDALKVAVYWKLAGGSESANYAFGKTTGDDSAGCVLRFTVSSTPTLSMTTNEGLSGTSISAPAITALSATDFLIRGAVGYNGVTWTSPASHTERVDITSMGATGLTVATRQLAASGSVAAASFTASGSQSNASAFSVLITEAVVSQTITPTGISSGEAFGTTKLNRNLTTTGIASAAAVGTPRIISVINPSGIASGEAFGTPFLFLSGLILPIGIPSGEAFGTVSVFPDLAILPTGIPSSEAFGTLSIQMGYPETLILEGIPSQEAIGFPTLSLLQQWVLRPNSIQETPMAMNILHVRYGIHRGITIIRRQDGTYYETRYPAQTELEESAAFYMGGYIHRLPEGVAQELIDAGYGDYLTLEDVA